jgi:hypothetical protein
MLLALVVGAIVVLWAAISTLRSTIKQGFERQDELLLALSEKLDALQNKVDEVEYRSLVALRLPPDGPPNPDPSFFVTSALMHVR